MSDTCLRLSNFADVTLVMGKIGALGGSPLTITLLSGTYSTGGDYRAYGSLTLQAAGAVFTGSSALTFAGLNSLTLNNLNMSSTAALPLTIYNVSNFGSTGSTFSGNTGYVWLYNSNYANIKNWTVANNLAGEII